MQGLSGVLWATVLAVGAIAACSDSQSTRSPGHGGGAGEGHADDAGAGTQAGASTQATGGSGADAGSVGGAGAAGEPIGGADGGGTDGGGAGGAAPTQAFETSAAFCDAYAAELCSWATNCRSFADCKIWGGYASFSHECADARASEKGGFLSFAPEAAASCVEAVRGVVAECSAGPPFNNATVVAACTGVFPGSVKLGKQCTSADFRNVFDECDNGYCKRAVGDVRECLGTCVPFGQASEACDATTACAPGLFCNSGSCGPPLGLGEACSGGTCEASLRCAGEPLTCRHLRPAGEACEDDYDCVYPGACVDHKCATSLGLGAPCVGSASCQAAFYCAPAQQQGHAVCAARLPSAASCDPNAPGCVAGYGCAYKAGDYVCLEALGALNQPCGSQGCEAGLWCDRSNDATGTCRARSPQNGACTEDAGCVDSLYCVGAEPSHCGPPGDIGGSCSPLRTLTCSGDLFCARDTVTCAAPRAEGQTCNPIEPSTSCQAGLFCACLGPSCPGITAAHQAQDVCVQKRVDGQDCSAGYECKGAYCTSGKCSSVAPPSSNCTR
jgi:hypothetical protein